MRASFLLKLLFVPALALGVLSFSGSAFALDPVDLDNDSAPTIVEDSSTPNAGDNNYDSVPDSEQDTVATITNPNDVASPNAFVSLELVGEACDGDYICPSAWKIDEFKPVDVATLPAQPDGKIFPLGMFDITLSCDLYQRSIAFDSNYNLCNETNWVETEEGCEMVTTPIPANLKLLFDRVMDTTNWTMEKYDPVTNSYIDYSPYVTISTQEIGFLRTVVEWSIVDGGLGDDDRLENGYISDPLGPSVPITTAAATSVTTVASTISTTGLQHTGSNFAIYSLILGFLMVATGAVFVRKS